MLATKQSESHVYQNESLAARELVLVACREPKQIADQLSALAEQNGMSRSQLLSRFIHQVLSGREPEAPGCHCIALRTVMQQARDQISALIWVQGVAVLLALATYVILLW